MQVENSYFYMFRTIPLKKWGGEFLFLLEIIVKINIFQRLKYQNNPADGSLVFVMLKNIDFPTFSKTYTAHHLPTF